MSSPERKKEIRRVHLEGYQAAERGESIQTCPKEYLPNMNRFQWEAGYHSYHDEDEAISN